MKKITQQELMEVARELKRYYRGCLQRMEGVDKGETDCTKVEKKPRLAHTDLRGLDFNGLNLTGVSFFYADLRDVDLTNCIIDQCDLDGADITGTKFHQKNSGVEWGDNYYRRATFSATASRPVPTEIKL